MLGLGMLTAGGIGAALVAAFSQIRGFIQRIRTLVIGISYYEVSEIIAARWLTSKKGVDFGDRFYTISERYTRGRELVSFYLALKGKLHIRFIPMPVFVSYNDGLKITYIKGTLNPDIIMKQLFEIEKNYFEQSEKDENCKNSSYVYNVFGTLGNQSNRPEYPNSPVVAGNGRKSIEPDSSSSSFGGSNWGQHVLKEFGTILQEHILCEKNSLSFDGLFYEQEVLDSVNCLETWLKLQKWYAEKRIPWKRGLLLYGKTGTGKTSLVKAIGEKYSLDVFSFRLSTFSDNEFQDSVFNQVGNTPRIFLFEDIDIPLELRKTNNSHIGETPLTLSTFLNTIDGVKPLNNVFIILTTNCIEKLDSALLRPGRLDEKLELKELSKEGKEKIAQFILKEWPDDVKEFSGLSQAFTGAEFKEACVKQALKRKWESRA